MQAGSLLVKAGQAVAEGQRLGRVGFSGDSLFPHLHYTVTAGSNYPSQGVPSYFKGFYRVTGAGLSIARGQLDSGDIIVQPQARGARTPHVGRTRIGSSRSS
jgi:murein DD-endopeptidase MepM/ murein hydrolase activator NlpD